MEVKDGTQIVVTDPRCHDAEQLCVSVSGRDTNYLSYLNDWKRRIEELNKSEACMEDTKDTKQEIRAREESSSGSKQPCASLPDIPKQPNNNGPTQQTTPSPSTSPRCGASSRKKLSPPASPLVTPPPSPASSPSSPSPPLISTGTSGSLSTPQTRTSHKRAESNSFYRPTLSSIERINRSIKNRNWDPKQNSSLSLPPEILIKVFRFLQWPELLQSVTLVSRDWLMLTRSDEVWRQIYYEAFGSYYNQSALLQGDSQLKYHT